MSKWYCYESMNAVTGHTSYVTVTEADAIATGRAEHPGASDFAALEAFISLYHARPAIAPGYLAIPNPGERLRAYIADLGANGMAIFSAQVGIEAKNLQRMIDDKFVIIPKHVLKRLGFRREMVVFPLDPK